MNETGMNGTCLICGEERTQSTRRCKLCGMGLNKRYYTDGLFAYCSPWCAGKFNELFRLSSREERARLLKEEIVL